MFSPAFFDRTTSLNTTREIHSVSSQAGFTLVELVVSMALLGITVVGIFTFYRTAYQTQEASEAKLQAIYLAQDLREEILFRHRRAPVSGDVNSSNSNSKSRLAFDSVHDYAGWSASPPRDVSGNELSDYSDMKRSVSVQRLALNRWNELESGQGDYREITISIDRADQPLYELSFYVMADE